MGGAVSAGKDNDELVDNLCKESYIITPEVEKVFRQVDRADFMTFTDEQDRKEAYEDHAWRSGSLHLSAPCIYTRAMEALQLKRGVSFLNIGSGTGYLSTMAGLLIGPYGINHGIEIYPENIEFAQGLQAKFPEAFPWYDPLEFCEPLFVGGNGLLLSPGNLLYERIYCGAACPPKHAQLLKNMLTVGGILVMPHDNQLESISRVSETEWKMSVVLPSVSFAPLILPSQESVRDLDALEISVGAFSLKQYCRLNILRHLGRNKYSEIPHLPLPQHLKDYVGYYKAWGAIGPDVKLLCPMDHSKIESGSDGDSNTEGGAAEGGAGAGAGAEGGGGAGLRNGGYAHSMNINGRRMLLCNINGIYYQLPIESDDDSDDDENVDGDVEGDSEAGDTDEGVGDVEGDSEAGDTDEGVGDVQGEGMAVDSISQEDVDLSMDQDAATGDDSLSAGAVAVSEWEACKEFDDLEQHGASEL